MNKVDRSGDLEKQRAEDEARTAELERARLEHERREQAIRDQRRNRENEDQLTVGSKRVRKIRPLERTSCSPHAADDDCEDSYELISLI